MQNSRQLRSGAHAPRERLESCCFTGALTFQANTAQLAEAKDIIQLLLLVFAVYAAKRVPVAYVCTHLCLNVLLVPVKESKLLPI
jgi:hypothetical protein